MRKKNKVTLPKTKKEIKNNHNNIVLYYILVIGIPAIYLIYESYLLFFRSKIQNVTYTNLEGLLIYFGIFLVLILVNNFLAKKEAKLLLYVLCFLEFLGVFIYVFFNPIIDNILDILNILLLSTPFISGILLNLNIKG